ncbi:hypothetical protein [Amphritea sp.]|uniref:DUF7683 domain-containing protein n=1 Tax=Amphritea sp. TaxID=1872502 RepID=UPI0025B7BF4E|nr:hypothetical protein [Amphritea sp.]
MIDTIFNVRRYIAEYSEETEELTAEYDLASFDLVRFQAELNEPNSEDPMFDCYPIQEINVIFIEHYMSHKISWDFNKNSYFVEAHCI